MIYLQKIRKDLTNYPESKNLNKIKMESIIVHTKNAMELNALKSVLKDMNIEFEKFHKNTFHNQKTIKKVINKKYEKIGKPSKPKGL